MPEHIVVALIGIGGVLLGTIIGAFISYRYALGVVKKTEFLKASTEFKIAFSDFIHWLDYDAIDSSIRTRGKLSEFHKRHNDAINRFRIVLSKSKRSEFDIACKKFYSKKDKDYYYGYANLDNSPQREESKKFVLDNIYELLRFAE